MKRQSSARTCLSAVVVALAAVGVAAVAPAGAAQPWSEAHPFDVPDGGVADCLRAGAPGQLAVMGALGRRTIATDLLAFDGRQLSVEATQTLGWLVNCPTIASAPAAGTLLAAPVFDPVRRAWAMRIGGTGMPPVEVRRQRSEGLYPPAVALASSGAAVVAWYESGLPAGSFPPRSYRRLVVVTRPASDAPFGAARVVATETDGDPGTAPALGVDAAGRFTIAWQTVRRGRSQQATVNLATVAPDGSLLAAQTLAPTYNVQTFALAVAPDGGALLAVPGDEHLELHERLPGAVAFQPVPLPVPRGSDGILAVSLASGGGAVVADRTEPDTVVALLRQPGGRFGPPRLVTGRLENYSSGQWGLFLPDGAPQRPSPPTDSEHEGLSTALTAEGEVLVTWVDPPSERGAEAARVASGTLADGFSQPVHLGGRCRAANAIKPLTGRDGRLHVAWTDNARVRTASSVDVDVLGGGRAHVASRGTPARSVPAPAPVARASVVDPAVRIADPLRLRVRCENGPCDVRATMDAPHVVQPGDPADPPVRRDDEDRDERDGGGSGQSGVLDDVAPARLTASTTLARGATEQLLLDPYQGHAVAVPGASAPPVRLTTCVPGGAVSAVTVLRPRVRLVRPRPIPWLRDVRVIQRGTRFDVTWSTAVPAERADFWITPLERGESYAREPIVVRGRGRSSFARSFTVPRGRTVRRVALYVTTSERGGVDDVTTAPDVQRASRGGRS